MYKAVIIDDEEFARELIRESLEIFDNIEICGEFSDGFSGLKGITDLKPDLIFLDIQMPKLTGFEMLELLDDRPEIIFVTAFDQFAIKAFEQNAVDYLLKPYSEKRFRKAVSKALKSIQAGKSRPLGRGIDQTIEDQTGGIDRVVVKQRNGIKIIPVEEIVYIEAQDDYVMIYTKDSKFLKQKTMKFFENHLDKKLFIRIHRSYIVKIDQITRIEPYEKSAGIVILKDQRTVPVSRSGLSNLKKMLDV